MLLKAITDPADSAVELHSPALLHGVRRFVGRCEKIGLTVKGHVPGDRVRSGVDGFRRLRGSGADVRLHGRDIMSTERGLNPIHVRQVCTRAPDSSRGSLVDGRR